MEHALATGLYTTGAGQSSTMLVTELGPSLAMLGPLHQELSNVRLTPQLGGLLAHGGTTELRRDTIAAVHILYEWLEQKTQPKTQLRLARLCSHKGAVWGRDCT